MGALRCLVPGNKTSDDSDWNDLTELLLEPVGMRVSQRSSAGAVLVPLVLVLDCWCQLLDGKDETQGREMSGQLENLGEKGSAWGGELRPLLARSRPCRDRVGRSGSRPPQKPMWS